MNIDALVARFAYGSKVRPFAASTVPYPAPSASVRISERRRPREGVSRSASAYSFCATVHSRTASSSTSNQRYGSAISVPWNCSVTGSRRRRVVGPIGRQHAGTVRSPCQKSVRFRENGSHSLGDAAATRSVFSPKSGERGTRVSSNCCPAGRPASPDTPAGRRLRLHRASSSDRRHSIPHSRADTSRSRLSSS